MAQLLLLQQQLLPPGSSAAPPATLAAGRRRRRRRRPGLPLLLPLLLLMLLFLSIAAAPKLAAAEDDDTQLFNHEFTLPDDNVARGIAYRGDGHRLRSVLRALQRGRPVHLGVIGGSITWGHGVKVGEEDWFSLTSSNLARAFPRANVSHLSGALPATTSAFATPSIPKLVRPEADLVFVEYTVNDGWEDEPALASSERAKSFERTLRTLLSLPRRPAVVLMHAFPSNASRAALPFWASEEDAYGVLAQYYGVASLSVRDAIWHEYMAAARILRRAQGEADDAERKRTGNETALAPAVDPSLALPRDLRGFGTWEVNQLDERHPTQRGQRMMADLVVGLLQREFVEDQVRRAVRARRRRAAAAAGAEAAAAAAVEEEEEEGGGGGGGGALLDVHSRAPLPPPMYEGNAAGAVALQCLLGEELASVAAEGLAEEAHEQEDEGRRPKQWRLVNDGDARKPKWGLVADAPGAELVLVLDTRVAGRGARRRPAARDDGEGEGQGEGKDGAAAATAAAPASSPRGVGDDARRHDRLRRRLYRSRSRSRALSSWWSFWETASAAAARKAAAQDAPRPRHEEEQQQQQQPAAASGAPPPPADAPLDAELWVGITRSWRGQGLATLSCEGEGGGGEGEGGGGCRCERAELRGFFGASGRKVTQNYVVRVPVSQSARCRVVVRLPDEKTGEASGAGPDGGRRVKLVGLTVASSLPSAAEAAAAAGGGC